MNNFDKVFTVIKKHCTEPDTFNGHCYGKISEIITGDEYLPIEVYLETLASIGLINYSPKTREISITTKGTQTERLFHYNN